MKEKYPALRPELNLKTRWELIDYDYVDKLSDKEKRWLNKFTEEYTNAKLNHKGKKLHSTKKLRKDCYDMNNSRNRCILTRSKACGKTVNLGDINEKEEIGDQENRLIDMYDTKKNS